MGKTNLEFGRLYLGKRYCSLTCIDIKFWYHSYVIQKVINIYKPVGITPLQLIQKFKQENPQYQDLKISYAGRLDPMAHGQMLLLVGEENKNREKYLNLDKTYEFTSCFGMQTDSYDFLGILKNINYQNPPQNLEPLIKEFINKSIGKQTQEYPPYSTKTVFGKPLFKWAREGQLEKIKIPKREIEIYSFELKQISNISQKNLKNYIFKNIKKLDGDFRQQEILEKWEEFFQKNEIPEFTTAIFQVSCSSGTYIRSLANRLGEVLTCKAITIEIHRTEVG